MGIRVCEGFVFFEIMRFMDLGNFGIFLFGGIQNLWILVFSRFPYFCKFWILDYCVFVCLCSLVIWGLCDL